MAEYNTKETGEQWVRVVEKNSDFFFPSVLDGISLCVTVEREMHVGKKREKKASDYSKS